MQSRAATVEQYLAELPPERRESIKVVRDVIRRNIDKKAKEQMQYGMIGWAIPHSIFPKGYHCDPKQPLPFAGLASQKNHMSMYVSMTYGNAGEEAWLRDRWAAAGKKLDMGKCCIRFKRLEDLPLEVVAELFRRISVDDYIAYYERMLEEMDAAKAARKAAKGAGRVEGGGAGAAKKAGAGGARKPVAKAGASKAGTAKKAVAKSAKKVVTRTAKKTTASAGKNAAGKSSRRVAKKPRAAGARG